MGDYTDQDRERSQKSVTLLEQHIKLSDERHGDFKKMLEIHDKKISDTEKKVIDNEKAMVKVMTIYSVFAIPAIAALAAFGRKFIN